MLLPRENISTAKPKKEEMYINPRLGEVSVEKMAKEISKFVKKEPHKKYKLVIGTDSQVHGINGKSECNYVTAIIIHREGFGARYFWKKRVAGKPKVLREKIYTETVISLEVAEHLVPTLRGAVGKVKYELEIHVDVGELGKTREMIKEVVGMVNGNGYSAKTKPASWGASSVADKHT